MYPVSVEYLKVLEGYFNLRATASAYLDGELTAELQLAPGGTVTRDWASKSVTTVVRLPVVDEEGTLFRLSKTAPLAPFGQQVSIQALLEVGDAWAESVPIGTFRVVDPGPGDGGWVLTRAGWRRAARALTVDAVDLLELVRNDVIVREFGPLANGTVRSESARLVNGSVPMGDWSAPQSVPSGALWEDDRLNALADVALLAGLVPSIDRDGAYRPLPVQVKATPDWTIRTAASLAEVDAGTVVSVRIASTVDELVTGWAITSEDADQKPIRGVDYVRTGALRHDGPFGRKIKKEHNPLMSSTALANSAAATRLRNHLGKLMVPVEVTCVPNPALDILDTVRIESPELTMSGLVTHIALPLSPGEMQLTVSIPWEEVWDE